MRVIYRDLIERILEIVLRELATPKKTALVLCDRTPQRERRLHDFLGEDYRLEFSCQIYPEGEWDTLIVESLSVGAIGRLALASAINETEELILKLLLEGKRLVVLDSPELNPQVPIAAVVRANLEKLVSYGTVFLDKAPTAPKTSLKHKRLICERDVMGLAEKSVVEVGTAIITSLARDVLQEKQITVIKSDR